MSGLAGSKRVHADSISPKTSSARVSAAASAPASVVDQRGTQRDAGRHRMRVPDHLVGGPLNRVDKGVNGHGSLLSSHG